jgi:hypothetical protein
MALRALLTHWSILAERAERRPARRPPGLRSRHAPALGMAAEPGTSVTAVRSDKARSGLRRVPARLPAEEARLARWRGVVRASRPVGCLRACRDCIQTACGVNAADGAGPPPCPGPCRAPASSEPLRVSDDVEWPRVREPEPASRVRRYPVADPTMLPQGNTTPLDRRRLPCPLGAVRGEHWPRREVGLPLGQGLFGRQPLADPPDQRLLQRREPERSCAPRRSRRRPPPPRPGRRSAASRTSRGLRRRGSSMSRQRSGQRATWRQMT